MGGSAALVRGGLLPGLETKSKLSFSVNIRHEIAKRQHFPL